MMNFLLGNLIVFGYFCQVVLAGQPYIAASMPRCSVANVAEDIESVCGYISRGDFEGAQRSLQLCRDGSADSVRQLREIIADHKRFTSQREAANGIYFNQYDTGLKNLSDYNLSENPEKLAEALTLAVKAYGVAGDHQKQSILDDPFVNQVIDMSLSRSFYLEEQGDWLGAYTDCYRHLQMLYPDEVEYLEYSRNLLAKNEILVSLSDSPCENFSDRHAGIDADTFVKAVDMLDDVYVVRITDYRAVAESAIKRCSLLAEVISVFATGNSNGTGTVLASGISTDLNLRAGNRLSDWKRSLTAAGERLGSYNGAVSKEKLLEIFRQVLADNDNTIGLPPEVLIYHFSQGAFSGLDSHTGIIWPQQVEDFTKNISGKFSGIGVTFSKDDGHWVITGLLLDTPAYRSSLQTGDVIYAVDDVETANMTSGCLAGYITGVEKSPVKLTLRTPGSSGTKDVKLKRAAINVPSVRGWQRTASGKWIYMIDPENLIGYIRIALFTENTADDFNAALEQLEDKGLNGLVLDLRSNPGGRVDAAVEVVDNFIEKGMIVSVRPRFGMPTYYSAHKNDRERNYPITILIDSHTASAAEIVAGAMQDENYMRATLVGNRSFGKGSVQSLKSLEEKKSKLKMTLAYYHLPSGQKVEAGDIPGKSGSSSRGVTPDVEIELTPDEGRKVAEIITANETLVSKKQARSSAGVRRYSNVETISYDPQLYTAILVLKAKMIGEGVVVR